MKRMVLVAAIALSILSCAQHDTTSPDTSGVDPQNPNRTTTTGDSMTNGSGSANDLPGNTQGGNMNNDNTNNNQQVNTGDSSLNKKRNQ